MHDSYLLLTPLLTLLVVALVGFVGCDIVWSIDEVPSLTEVQGVEAVAGNMQVDISWLPRAEATRYTVHMGTTSKTYTAIKVLEGAEFGTHYTWPQLMNGTTYYFMVTATIPDGETWWSEEKSATPGLQGIVTQFITFKQLGTTRNDFSGWVGIGFQLASSDVIALSLGRIFAPGNTASHMLKLVDGTTKADVPGTLVAVTPNVGTPGEFVYVDLPAPVTLTAGNKYYLQSQEQINGDLFYNENTQVTTTNIASTVFPVFATNLGAYTEGATTGYEYGPLDFKYTLP